MPMRGIYLRKLIAIFMSYALTTCAAPSKLCSRPVCRQRPGWLLQKHHLLTWARGAARAHTHEAQQRVRLYEKVETANRALECIDSALKIYPDEEELKVSARAVQDFITSSRVAHWVELAERAAFKGQYRRAIDRYRDALFFLTRDGGDNREAGAERIAREIELLRARHATSRASAASTRSPRGPEQ
jgi:tetratricopeptide (TPR) repeat protein